MTQATQKNPPPNPVSEADKDSFTVFVKSWQQRLGLNDWRIERSLRKTKNMAEVKIEHLHRLATYRIGEHFGGSPVNAKTLEATALHELLHVLLAELVNQVEYGIEGEALESAEHRVINTLEKLLLKD